MEKTFIKYCIGASTYGLVRTFAYAPPMKKDEYIIDRVIRTLFFTMLSPCVVPNYIYRDMKNIEHRIRKMHGPMDRNPW
jgi:hypothetical protein